MCYNAAWEYAMSVTINLPDEIERRLRTELPDLDAQVKEAAALDLFRRGRLSHCELSMVLTTYLKGHSPWKISRSRPGRLIVCSAPCDPDACRR